MAFIEQIEIDKIKGKLTSDLSSLGKLYKAKKSKYQTQSIDHSLVEDMLKKGWEIDGKPLSSKTKIRKIKDNSRQFEDDIWCQFYELGFRHLNYDQNFKLPFSSASEDTKQIDVVAKSDDTIFLIECKSSENIKKAPSYKDEFDLLGLRLDGFRKVIEQCFGRGLKIKFIFATRNLRLDTDDIDFKRFEKTGSFYYNDNTYDYINSLIKNYKNAALYQFLGMIFKNELINSDKIEVPAVEGNMGGKIYYMFSIEPALLLKMSFVLHRTRANEAEFPTYQRLLVPSRLKGITKYINDGGFFPNSLIINFSQNKHKLQFEHSSRFSNDTTSRFGTLKIPNAYAIAYIIDGQHRLYGYANSKFLDTNTIPVVAFDNLSTKDQLDIFMDINQNQKAVSPSLRTDLEEDLFWDSPRADMRLKALRSSIIKGLSNTLNGPLYNKITVGEDKALLSTEYFKNALMDSGLVPQAKGNNFIDSTTKSCLYNINNQDHQVEMNKTKKEVVQFINYAYDYVSENYSEIFKRERYFITSNRGSYAFVTLIGSLNSFLTDKGELNRTSSPKERFLLIEKYLKVLMEGIKKLSIEEEDRILTIQGQGAQDSWLRFFQNIINSSLSEYSPIELIDWKERQDEQLQDKGRKFGVEIEKKMKKLVLEKIKLLFGKNWELEINSIKTACQTRANEENEKYYKEGLDKRVDWTEMFNITDYKKIIEGYWTRMPSDETDKVGFENFQDEFSIDIGEGINGPKKALKWISFFNSYRNMWAHEGTKEKRLNKEEVDFLERIYSHFYKNTI